MMQELDANYIIASTYPQSDKLTTKQFIHVQNSNLKIMYISIQSCVGDIGIVQITHIQLKFAIEAMVFNLELNNALKE